jgi:hypothetical protein
VVRGAVPVKIAHVQPFVQNLVRCTLVEPLSAQRHALASKLRDEAVDRILASTETGKQLCDDPRGVGVGRDDALAVGAVDVPVPHWGKARIYPGASLLQHSLMRFFGEIVDEVLGHQDLHACA